MGRRRERFHCPAAAGLIRHHAERELRRELSVAPKTAIAPKHLVEYIARRMRVGKDVARKFILKGQLRTDEIEILKSKRFIPIDYSIECEQPIWLSETAIKYAGVWRQSTDALNRTKAMLRSDAIGVAHWLEAAIEGYERDAWATHFKILEAAYELTSFAHGVPNGDVGWSWAKFLAMRAVNLADLIRANLDDEHMFAVHLLACKLLHNGGPSDVDAYQHETVPERGLAKIVRTSDLALDRSADALRYARSDAQRLLVFRQRVRELNLKSRALAKAGRAADSMAVREHCWREQIEACELDPIGFALARLNDAQLRYLAVREVEEPVRTELIEDMREISALLTRNFGALHTLVGLAKMQEALLTREQGSAFSHALEVFGPSPFVGNGLMGIRRFAAGPKEW